MTWRVTFTDSWTEGLTNVLLQFCNFVPTYELQWLMIEKAVLDTNLNIWVKEVESV